jgi:phage baseplate assembly protein W
MGANNANSGGSDSSFLGTGWAYPPSFDNASLQLRMSSGADNIRQSIDVLLRTPKGSRSLMPDFGCNLGSFTFRKIDATVKEEIVQSVKTTLLEGEPRIDVEQVTVTPVERGTRLNIGIVYVVRKTNARHNHVFPFSQLEGTNLEIDN